MLPAEHLRPAIARRRERWRKYQGRLDPARLVFVDETWAKTNMAPLRGWAPVGQRLHAKVPYRQWKTMTFPAALRCDPDRRAICVRSADQRGQLHRPGRAAARADAWPGDVIMDNLSSHKRPAIRAAIRARGARLLYLPPYSPDLNPIEQVFAKLKHLLRKAAERIQEATWHRIGILLDAFPPHKCANYLANSEYASP